jgi:hypothetical protein
VQFWPFVGWDIPVGRSAIAEVYPASWSRGLANDGCTGDMTPSASPGFRAADHDGNLVAFPNPDLFRRLSAGAARGLDFRRSRLDPNGARRDDSTSNACDPNLFRLY